MAGGPQDAERLLCDTSFHIHASKRTQRPERYEHWPVAVLERIDAAILAISVITLAEARYGYIKGGLTGQQVAEEEARLAAYLAVPMDMEVINEWARLRAKCESAGVSVPDNDLWIAATACARKYPLVTCDTKHQGRIDDEALELIVIAVDVDPPAPP
jgi:predicted nucleic acid-binding protein